MSVTRRPQLLGRAGGPGIALLALLLCAGFSAAQDTEGQPAVDAPVSADADTPDDTKTDADSSGTDPADGKPVQQPPVVTLQGELPAPDIKTEATVAPPATQKPLTTLADDPGPTPAKKKTKGIDRVFDKLSLFQGLSATGQASFTLQDHSIDGSEDTFESQRWDTNTLERRTSLHLEGPVWKEFVFQADISDSGWGQDYSRWITGFVGHDTAILFGDLDLSVGGNEFVGFRKSTKGWQFDQKLPGNAFMRGFYSREKGLVRNQTFAGNDTAGPYFLTYTPVIESSEVVKVNEEFLDFGTDYRLDYDSGQLWFEPVDGQPRMITAADTVSVSYQSLGYNDQGPGELFGVRAEAPLLDDRLLVGFTTLQQKRAGAGGQESDTVGYQEDIYNGSGTTGPFDTNYRPIVPDGTNAVFEGERQIIDKALAVIVDSVEQVEGIDYDAYRSIGRIIFRRAVPPTALVIIRYYYDISTTTTATGGDKSLYGLDLAYQISDRVNWSMDWARSSADADNQSGDAMSSTLSYNAGPVRLLAEYRDIAPEYSYIDTVGFQKREKGLNLGAEWQVNDNVFFSNRYSSLDSDSGLSFGYSGYGGGSSFGSGVSTFASPAQSTSTTSLSVQTERNDTSLRLDFDGWPDISLGRNSMSNSGGSTGESEYTTDSINLQYSPQGAKYSFQTRFNRAKQRNTTDGDDGPKTTGTDSDQLQFSASYDPTSTLSFRASIADNSSSAIETVNESSSKNTQISARWNPSTKMGMELSRSLSESSGRVSSQFYTTYTPGTGTGIDIPSGYNPGGGPDDDDDDDTTERPGTEDTTDRFSVFWRPNDTLSFDLNIGAREYRSTGSQGYLADSTQDYWNAGAMWQASNALSLNLSIGNDNLQFLDEDQGAVKNRSYVLSAGYRPPGKPWNAGLTLNIQDGSSPTQVGFGRLQSTRNVATNLRDISGQFSYMINEDLSLQASAGISDYDGGYSNFKKQNGEIRARYRLSSTVGLDFGYRYIRHISRATQDDLIFGTSGSGGNYVASTFLLNLSTSFRGGIGSSGTGALGPGYGMRSGFSGGPGTFGGYTPGLQTGRQYGTGYGTGMGNRGMGTGGIGSGFGTGSMNSYSSGYGPSQFDTIGTGMQRRTSSGMFGTSPFGDMPSVPTTGSRGGIKTGIGEFRKEDRTSGTRPTGQAPTTRPGEDATGFQAGEDWWLLGDNAAYW